MHTARLFVAAACALALSGGASAQTFDSGSDGSDGALSFQPNSGVIVFDPVALGLDASDNVFNFTTIDVPTGTAVVLSAEVLGEGKPVYWLASGNVTITGVIDLDGEDGAPFQFNQGQTPSIAGAGGYNGGRGGVLGGRGHPGNGPGGGRAFAALTPVVGGGANGASAGYVVPGLDSTTPGLAGGGATYGNPYLQPIVGGSGGAGGTGPVGFENETSGGGAGGGALVIASSGVLRLDGAITADGGWTGGNGNQPVARGGAGSGGSLRLIAARVEGIGSLSALGGADAAGFRTSPGRIRIEAFRRAGPATSNPAAEISTPGSVFPPPTTPSLRLTQIDGVSVAATPTGAFEVPDVAITATAAVTLNLEATNVPLGTTLALVIRAEDGSQITATSTPLTGTLQSSTATAQVTFPSGFSRVFVTASWAP
ncbi:MAG: hypothetical protein R3F62_15870 [Planctomycetota bacterium]